MKTLKMMKTNPFLAGQKGQRTNPAADLIRRPSRLNENGGSPGVPLLERLEKKPKIHQAVIL
jgi:hypothetical protein